MKILIRKDYLIKFLILTQWKTYTYQLFPTDADEYRTNKSLGFGSHLEELLKGKKENI